MKKLLGFLTLIAISISCLFSSNKLVVNANSQAEINTLEISNQQHFANLNNISAFAYFSDNIYFVANGELNKYNTQTKQIDSLSYANVTNLKQAHNKLMFLANGVLTILNSDGTTFNVSTSPITATAFAVYFDSTTNLFVITYVNNNYMQYIKFNLEGEIISSTPAPVDIGIDSTLALATTQNYAYLIYSQGQNNNLVKIDLNIGFNQSPIANFTYMDCSNIEVINSNPTQLVVTTNTNFDLEFLTEQNNEVTEDFKLSRKSGLNPSFILGDVLNFTDVKIIDNKVYIATNSENSNIQEFSISNNSLVPNKIILASHGYDLGRFSNVGNINIVNNETFYVADTNNNRLQFINNDLSTQLTQVANTVLTQPKKVITVDNVNFYIMQNDEVLCYNKTLNTVNKITAIGVMDIALTQHNELFCVMPNGIYNTTSNAYVLSLFYNDTITNGKIEILNNNNLAYYNDKLYIYNIENCQKITEFEINNVLDLATDYYSNVYALNNNGITKYEYNTNYQLDNTYNFDYNFSNITCFDINKQNGEILCFNQDNQSIIQIKNNITTTLNEFIHPVNTQTSVSQSNIISFATTTKECYVFNYPNCTDLSAKLNINTNVYVLDSTTYSNYYYVMYNNNNIINYGYVKKDVATLTQQTTSTPIIVEAIYKNVKIYKYPTILKDIKNINFAIAQINQNDQLTCISKSVISLDNSNYYAIRLQNGTIGYVNASDVRDITINNIKSLPNPNATILSTTETVKLYSNSSTESDVVLEIKTNSKIYVENYDETKPFNKITYVDDNKVAHNGYIETKYIKLETTNAHSVSAYILLAVGIVLIISSIIVYIKYKKSKQN